MGDVMSGMGGYNGLSSNGGRIEDYLKGGSKVMLGGQPYEVYTMNLSDTQGKKVTAYVLVPAKYEKMPKGQSYGQKGTSAKAESPKINSSGKGYDADPMKKYFGGSGKPAEAGRYNSGTAEGPRAKSYEPKKDKKARK